MFDIDPKMAYSVYLAAKNRLEELEEKRAQLLSAGVRLPQLDVMIERQREEVQSCAYYAFGKAE